MENLPHTVKVPETLHEFFYDASTISYEQFILNIQEELQDFATHLNYQSLIKLSNKMIEFEQLTEKYSEEFLYHSLLSKY